MKVRALAAALLCAAAVRAPAQWEVRAPLEAPAALPPASAAAPLGASALVAAAALPEAAVPLAAALAPAAAPASAPEDGATRLYLMSQPLHSTAQLGPVARAAHAAGSIAWEALKAWGGWHATGTPMGAAAVMLVELPVSPAMLTGRTLLDLNARYWLKRRAAVGALARSPGVARVRVLTAGHTEFWGPMAVRKENSGLLFVESSRPPLSGPFGEPIPIADPARQRVRLTLSGSQGSSPTVWTTTLDRLLDRAPIPPEISAAWRESVRELGRGRAAAARLLDAAKAPSLRIEAALVGGASGDANLGAIAEGPAARALIGLGRLDRVRAFLGLSRRSRAIPVSDTRVERPGAARGPFWARAWERLTGRLISPPR